METIIGANTEGLLVYGGYSLRTVVRPLGGKWDARNGRWVLPYEVGVKRLVSLLPSARVTQEALDAEKQISSLLSIKESADADITYGDGIDAYQRVGVKFLVTARRAILADFPGAGKSAQAVRAAYEVGARKVLVVTRKSLIYNWKAQISLWSPKTTAAVEWSVTNYEQVVKHMEALRHERYDVLVVDEAQNVKNRKAKRSKAIHTLARAVPYVWLLTGTPVMNRPDELWSILHAVDHRRYSSYWRFVNEYCLLEPNRWSGGQTIVGLNPLKKNQLAAELAPVLLRRTAEVVDLPPITRENVYVELLPKQSAVYKQMLREFLVTLADGGYVYAPSTMAQLIRLRQITCTPALIGGPDESAKTEVIVDLVGAYAQDHKIVIFTTFAAYAKWLAHALSSYRAMLVCGDTPTGRRADAVHAINKDPSCRVLVGTVGAMGEGLNIQAADIVVFADLDWVPAAIEQAEARVYRRGQERHVHVIRLVAKNTIDEHILGVLANKDSLVREMDAITSIINGLKEGGDENGAESVLSQRGS